jgi:hypothetical protein
MKKIVLSFLVSTSVLSSALAQNLLNNSGFEAFAAGYNSYVTTGNGSAIGQPGVWQLTFVTGSCAGGCSLGSSQYVDTTQNAGTNSLAIKLDKQTNRNDVRLFQSIASIPASNNFVVTFYMKSGVAGYPVTVNVFKSTEGITSNGSSGVANPSQLFTTTTRWQQYKMYVDLTTWTTAERTNMRISIRPNTVTTTALPAGPYPKIFWFDDISFKPVDTLNELKDVAIQVATKRRYLALDSGYTAEANALQADIAVLVSSTPAAPITPIKAIGFNPVPTQTTAGSNPFIAALNTWAATYLSQTFVDYKKAVPTSFVFPNTADGRTLGTVTENLHWLLVSPYSNYRYNPELFRRFLSIVYATSDDYKMNGVEANALPGSTDNALNDWFAAPKTCYAWRMAEFSFSDYIVPTLKQRLKDAADSIGKQFNLYASALSVGLYTNRDISYAETLLHAGMYRNNNLWIDFAKRIVDSVNLVGRYTDGAYSYIEKQNEVANYHGATNNSLAKMWAVIEYQPAWECISKTANYEMIGVEKGAVPEFYTAPAWKTQWNGLTGASAEPLLAITQNPYLKTTYNRLRAIEGYDDEMPLSMAFYNPNISALPLPENYVCYDRNIKGPRGRYGQFSYATVGRQVDVPGSNDPGLQTIVGAMETQTGTANNDLLNAALMAVHSKVHVKTSTNTQWQDWAYMMAKTSPKICVANTVSTISTPSVLQYQTTGPTGVETNWASYQQWITLPDRIIGIVETYPKNNAATNALEIDQRIRFTYARRTAPFVKYLVEEVPGVKYGYGKFKTIIHAHDFTTVTTDTAGVLRDEYRNAMEIIFRYNLSSANTQYAYPASTKKYFIVEIKDSMAYCKA